MSPSDLVILMRDAFDAGDWDGALHTWVACQHRFEVEEICWVWGFLESGERAFLKDAPRKYPHAL